MFPNEREFWVVHQQLGGDFTGDAGGILLFSFVIAWCITWRARLLVLCILKPCRFGRTCFPCRLLMPVWLKGRFALCDRARGKPNSAAELWECWHRESFLLEVWDDWGRVLGELNLFIDLQMQLGIGRSDPQLQERPSSALCCSIRAWRLLQFCL